MDPITFDEFKKKPILDQFMKRQGLSVLAKDFYFRILP
jgi:hypothetical protein